MAERGAPAIHIFLVGFPRSGTTLVQSLLAAHPDVLSLPETFFFMHAFPSGRRWRLTRRAHPDARMCLRELEAHGIEVAPRGMRDSLPIASAGPTVRRFVRSLDATAHRDGKLAWVEKTPSHLHYVDTIERHVPDAKFVHIVRSGASAIASLYSVTHEHPEPWGGARSLETCISRWRSDIRTSYGCTGRPNHAFVSYERLVDDPSVLLLSLTRRLGLGSDLETIESMLANYAGTTSTIVDNEPWKSSVAAPIVNRNAARMTDLFSPAERERIERSITREEQLLAGLPLL
jgi:hypothetical protein